MPRNSGGSGSVQSLFGRAWNGLTDSGFRFRQFLWKKGLCAITVLPEGYDGSWKRF